MNKTTQTIKNKIPWFVIMGCGFSVLMVSVITVANEDCLTWYDEQILIDNCLNHNRSLMYSAIIFGVGIGIFGQYVEWSKPKEEFKQ